VDGRGFKNGQVYITRQDIYKAIQTGRISPFVKAKDKTPRVGRVLALGVMGYIGSLLEIEAIAFDASKPGHGVYKV
jgi:ATP-dependent Lon protease